MSLLDRFREGSELNSVGFFTLDESKAKKKMSRYQLVQLEEFLLLVVQAVVAAGCSEIAITTNKNQIRLEAIGTDLDPEKLSRLEDFLFDTRPEALPYYLIGVAENAVEPSSEAPARTGLEEGTFFFDVSTRERLMNLPYLLPKRLYYIDCPVSLNGEQLTTEPLGNQTRMELSKASSSQITLVRHGVVLTTRFWADSLNFLAVTPANHLTLDASFADVVDDDALAALLSDLQVKASQQLAALLENHQPRSEESCWYLELLETVKLEPARSALASCLLFPLADREGYCSWDELVSHLGSNETVLVSKSRFNLQLDVPVVQLQRGVLTALHRLLGASGVQDAEPAYRRKLEAIENKARWEASPRPTELPPGNYLARRELVRSNWQAELGILGAPGGKSSLDILYQGKLLTTESLEGVPPGSAVVLNFDKVGLDDLWSRATGRIYRNALKEVKHQLLSLFNNLELEEPNSLYPALVVHLQNILSDKEAPPPVARYAPIFLTIDGRYLSLEDVSQQSEILLGSRVNYPDTLPEELRPRTVLLYDSTSDRILRKRFPSRDVVDFRSIQEHLVAIGKQLATPLEPKFGPGETWISTTVKEEGLTGEVALVKRQGKDLTLSLLHRGAILEGTVLSSNRVFQGRAILQAESLTPTRNWSSFVKDQSYKNVLKRVKALAEELETGVLSRPETEPELVLSLLHAYPQFLLKHEDKTIFPSTRPNRSYSLRQLLDELGKHGHLLRGELGMMIEDRLVVRFPLRPEIANLLKRGLGDFLWVDAGEIIHRQAQERSFLAQEVHAEIKVKEQAYLVVPVPSGRGEIAIGCLRSEFLEGVTFFFGGRRICFKTGVLPDGCVAAWENEAFVLNEDFDDVDVPQVLLDELRESCAEGMLELVAREQRQQRLFALKFFAHNPLSTEVESRFSKLELFETQGGGRVSLSSLKGERGALHYVDKTFPPDIPTDDLVLRLCSTELTLLHQLTKRRLLDSSNQLKEQFRAQLYLARLPTALDPSWFQMNFEGKYLRGQVGILEEFDWVVGQDDEGQTLGYIQLDSLPVVAVVQGAIPQKKSKQSTHHPEATLGVMAGREFQGAVDEIYLRWARDLAHRAFNERTRSWALKILSLTKRELGSDASHPQAEIARLLWEIPMFERVDGTFVSGSELADKFLTEPPLVVADKRQRKTPEDVLLLKAGSKRWEILRAVFGTDGLRWYEAPPLIDPDLLKSNIERLTAWGMTPVAAARTQLRKAAGFLESKLSPPQATKKKKKPKERKKVEESPEDKFLKLMRTEIVNFLGRSHLRGSDKFFKTTEMGSWVLGPPVYLSGGVCRFNRAHSSVRWFLDGGPDSKQKRLGRLILLIHWVGLVNVTSVELTDEHEREFLIHLGEKMLQTYGAGSSKISH